jgi:hypothetical protein
VLADDERTDRVVGGKAARVSDDVGVAGAQAEGILDGQPGIHAGEDGELASGWKGQARPIELGGVPVIFGKSPGELWRRDV